MGREEVGKSPMSVCPRRGVRKAPISMYVEKKLGRPPCLCEQGEGWEGPHIYVYKEAIEKALMFVCAGRGRKTSSRAGCWLGCRRGLGLPESKLTRASEAGAEAGLTPQESCSVDTALPVQEAHLPSIDSVLKLPVPPSSVQRRPRPTLVSPGVAAF